MSLATEGSDRIGEICTLAPADILPYMGYEIPLAADRIPNIGDEIILAADRISILGDKIPLLMIEYLT